MSHHCICTSRSLHALYTKSPLYVAASKFIHCFVWPKTNPSPKIWIFQMKAFFWQEINRRSHILTYTLYPGRGAYSNNLVGGYRYVWYEEPSLRRGLSLTWPQIFFFFKSLTWPNNWTFSVIWTPKFAKKWRLAIWNAPKIAIKWPFSHYIRKLISYTFWYASYTCNNN